jgi:alpha-glucosidase
MTNDDERSIEVPLSFLGEGSYNATIYSDAADADQHPENIDVDTREVNQNDTLSAKLAHGGGYTVHFDKINQ